MEARLQRRIQQYGWDRSAVAYEQYWREALEPVQRRLLELAALAPGERVLDVACGTGLVSWRAAAAVAPGGTVVGIDLSEGMLRRARQAAPPELAASVRFEHMGAEEILLAGAEFDVALCALGLMYVPDPLQALREMRRVLRPGGRVAVSVWGQRDRCGWAGLFPVVDARVRSEVCPLFFRLGTRDTLAQTLDSAGFTPLAVERLAYPLRYASAEEACGAAFAGGPVALAYARFDAATRASAHAEYLASLEPYRRGEGYEVPSEFVVALGRES